MATSRSTSGSEVGRRRGSADHRAVARETVQRSLVLLKNEGGALPLPRAGRILGAGHAADDRGAQCGGFTVAWQGSRGNALIEGGTSIWEALSAAAEGAVLDTTAATLDDDAAYDVAVVVIGEGPYAEGMGDIRPKGSLVKPGSGAPSTYGSGAANLKKADLHPYAETLVHAVNRGARRTRAPMGAPDAGGGLERSPIRTIVVLRLFMQGAAPLNAALALTPVGFCRYALATALGLIPPTIVAALLTELFI